MKIEKKDPEFALYYKQNTLERLYSGHWACGFAGLITCMRLLGDRRHLGSDLVKKQKQWNITPSEGLASEEIIRLANRFGYKAKRYPKKNGLDRLLFKKWLKNAWQQFHPVMIGSEPKVHWMVAYNSGEEDREVWIMNPVRTKSVFHTLPMREVLSWPTEADDDSGLEYYCALEIYQPNRSLLSLPPSNKLIEFINEEDDFKTTCIVDNFLETILDGCQSNNTRDPLAYDLLENIESNILNWEGYFSNADLDDMQRIRELLRDIEFYRKDRIQRSKVEFFKSEVQLLLAILGPWL
jgi:hypothetical protein